eukprot:s204_g15.t1
MTHLRAVAQRLEVAEERQETDSPRLAVGLKSLNGKVEALGEELSRLVQAQTVTENDLPRWKDRMNPRGGFVDQFSLFSQQITKVHLFKGDGENV